MTAAQKISAVIIAAIVLLALLTGGILIRRHFPEKPPTESAVSPTTQPARNALIPPPKEWNDPDTGQPVFDPSNCATNVQAITSPQSFTVASTGFSNFSAAPTAGPITQSGLPAGCAFFTRPAVDEDGTRLNYWSEGSYVCYRGEGYLCDGDPRHWVDRGICLAPSYDAVALECSGLNTAVYEGDPKTVCNTGGAGEISAKTESDPDSTPNH